MNYIDILVCLYGYGISENIFVILHSKVFGYAKLRRYSTRVV